MSAHRIALIIWLFSVLSCLGSEPQPGGSSGAVQSPPVKPLPVQFAAQAGYGAGKPNRLAGEISPYLLQHAYNPVDWYPWGEEAFQQARKKMKPIFLSIGYSTCHWCHVMERESFSNPEIAALMNQHFVCIKVDREERPDIDSVYMTFVQAATGRGGWPMSVFLTPELKPFFGGTYFPPESRPDMPSFPQVLETVHQQWSENRDEILNSANRIVEHLRSRPTPTKSQPGNLSETLDKGYQWYKVNFDQTMGGFGTAPKFPRPVNLQFLFYYSRVKGSKHASKMALKTLQSMARGGMNDHLGGGFHRYSTDERWFLPHFEKMLYDQAQLVVACLEAFQISQDAYLANVARETLAYVLRDMANPGGGFYSAEDADSRVAGSEEEEAEGAFYAWSQEEILRHLDEKTGQVFSRRFGVQSGGNVARDPFSEFENKNVLYQNESVEKVASDLRLSTEQVQQYEKKARQLLFEVRKQRPRPLRDDKILTSWNGLMISALARASQILENEDYLKEARNAACFIRSELYDLKSRTLYRRYRSGERGIPGFLDDYAFLIQGLIDLYEASLEEEWLLWAMDLTQEIRARFWDQEEAGFFSTTGEDRSVLLRMKDRYDGAEPSPNSVTLLNLIRLGNLSGDERLLEMVHGVAKTFSGLISSAPHGMPLMLVALSRAASKPIQIFLAGQRKGADTRSLLREVHRRYLPNRVVFLADGGSAHRRLAARMEILDSFRPIDGRATAYVCENYVCRLPTTDPRVMGEFLDLIRR